MLTIKTHTHKERMEVAEKMIPIIKKKFGESLIVVAVRGSTARNTDGPYSDLEMFAIIKKMPKKSGFKGFGKSRKIIDGLLIELLWITPENYIGAVREISGSWFGSGADYLLPLMNKKFVQKLNGFKPKNKEKKCMDQAVFLWDHLQESATKVLNAAYKKNRTGMPLVLGDTFSNMLKMVAFMNATPYTTFSRLVDESRKMKYRPKDFEKLTKLIVDGEYGKFSEISKFVLSVMSEFEARLLKKGYTLDSKNFEITF